MQALVLIILAAASVSGLGSGPYLPSGWKPQGPAFYLPSEVQKPAENPLKDTTLQESEASGSDALREYGPPKFVEVSQDLTRQALPDAVTEQAFVSIEAKITEEVNGEVREVSEVRGVQEVAVDAAKTEVVSEAVAGAIAEALEDAVQENEAEEAVTAAVAEAVEDTTSALESAKQGKAIDVAINDTPEVSDATTESVEITTADETSEAFSVESTASVSEEYVESTAAVSVEKVVDSNVESTQVQQVTQAQEVNQVEEVSQAKAEVAQITTAEEVNNVVAELVYLENEIKAQQAQSNEDALDVKSIQILGSELAPEGFLEYGPPGFREYGPPQAGELLRNGALVQESTQEEQKVENNETRRRRFSPKFRSTKKQH